ncbi:MAG: cytochrome oxidase small assembly protein [Hylemonella sp.]|nr:cytochrome oxidase small assembly protein [Hylemonella sp.]
MTSEEQKKANVRTALILLTVVLTFLAGFVIKVVVFGR